MAIKVERVNVSDLFKMKGFFMRHTVGHFIDKSFQSVTRIVF